MLNTPVFNFNLKEKLVPGLVTIGKYINDRGKPNLTVVTTANKVLIYDVENTDEESFDPRVEKNSKTNVTILNMNQVITSITSGRLIIDDRDVLIVCTKVSVYVYDVCKNRDVFHKEVTDGCNVVVCGMLNDIPMVLVGGNCSVQGFDKEGGDPYWIVTGDNVKSMTLNDINDDGKNELVVGSDDYDIRIFKNEDLVHEITETQMVTHLYSVGSGMFAYALANGTVGVYDKIHRAWRVKSKNRATCLATYDINGDGEFELITGWQGGKVDGRNIKTGEVIFKDMMDDTIAGICEGDHRGTGENDLIVVSVGGEVRGYNPHVQTQLKTTTLNIEQESIRELFARKHTLLLELKNYECSGRLVREGDENSMVGAIPARTRLQTSVAINLGNSQIAPHVEIFLSTNNETVIRAVLVFAEGIFKGETFVSHPKTENVSQKIKIPLYPPRDVPIDVHIKALIGYPDSQQYHVFELTRQLPRFSLYAPMDDPPHKSESYVNLFVNERVQRVILWINKNFLLTTPLDINNSNEIKMSMISLRDGKELKLEMDATGKIKITTDNIQLAGDVIQSLGNYLNISNLKSFAHYPREEENVINLLEKIGELDNVKRRLNLDLSDKSNVVRNLIVRIEDLRLLGDIKTMRRLYQELNDTNQELIASYEIRVNNVNDLSDSYRELNNVIQKAARLRIGFSVSLTSKNNYTAQQLIKIIRSGEI